MISEIRYALGDALGHLPAHLPVQSPLDSVRLKIIYNYLLTDCSLINSVIITVLLTGMTAMILLRALHRDINRYNQVDATVRT